MNVGYLKVTFFSRRQIADVFSRHSWPSIMIICVQPQTWGVSAGSREWRVTFLFFCNCDGALPGLCALRKQHTLHISIVNIAQTGPQGHFSLGPQRGRGSSPPGPFLVHATVIYIYIYIYIYIHTYKPEYNFWTVVFIQITLTSTLVLQIHLYSQED